MSETGIAFDFAEKGHIYTTAEGIVPSVSQVLTLAGISDVSMIPVRNLIKAGDIGTAVHLACEYLDHDDLDLESIDPAILGYVVGYQRFKETHSFKPEMIEHAMIGEVEGMRYGMRFDRLGLLDDSRVLFDIKTASRPSPSWPIQTAAYQVGYSSVDPFGPPRRAVVHLSKEGTFKLLWHTLDTDFHIWQSALSVALWRLQNGAKLKE